MLSLAPWRGFVRGVNEGRNCCAWLIYMQRTWSKARHSTLRIFDDCMFSWSQYIRSGDGAFPVCGYYGSEDFVNQLRLLLE